MIPYVEPMKTPDGEPFWEGCKNKQLLIPKCHSCNQYYFYPRMLCPNCWSEDVTFEQVSGKGILYSYTRVFPKTANSYLVVLIELEEGVRLMSNLLVDENTPLKVGLPVVVSFTQILDSETVLPQFVLEGSD